MPQAMLQLVLETALDAVVVMRADGTIADWSGVAEQIFGWSRLEVHGASMADLIIPEKYRSEHHRGLRTYLETGQGPVLRRRIELSALRRSGEEFPIELSITPVQILDEVLFLGFIRDISQRQRSEQLLARKAREAILLHEVTSLAAEAVSFDQVLRLCLSSVCELAGWPLGHAYLPTGHPPELVPSLIWNDLSDQFQALREITKVTRMSPGVGLPGHIWMTGKPLWISDIYHDPLFVRSRSGIDLGVKSAFGFPIKSKGEVIAVLEFFSQVQAEPDPALLRLVETIGDQLGRVLERKRIEDHRELLLAELNHRVKNMLAVVLSMAAQTAREGDSAIDFQKGFSERINSLARVHSLLTDKNWTAANLRDLFLQVLDPHMAEPGRQLEMTGTDIFIPPKEALSLSLILNELSTNAAKYGALSVPAGRIQVAWSRAHEAGKSAIKMAWRETGLLGLEAPTRAGFGSQLIEAITRHELGGGIAVTYHRDGVQYDFEFPANF